MNRMMDVEQRKAHIRATRPQRQRRQLYDAVHAEERRWKLFFTYVILVICVLLLVILANYARTLIH